MARGSRDRFLAVSLAALLSVAMISSSRALVAPESLTPPSPKAILDLRDAIVKGLGLESKDMKVTGFDVRDALVGQAVSYEFDIEVGKKKVVPIKLLEDVSLWDFVDLPIFRSSEQEKALLEMSSRKARRDSEVSPTLPPFQLAGPMELWIQDGDDVRLALPHDVDAGSLKKVVLSDGAVVTVKGARSVTLRHPLELPLPLNRTTYTGKGAGLLAIAQSLREAARSYHQKPLLSLRIVGPISLSSAPSSPSSSSSMTNRLKLKRLAPGSVELSSHSSIPAISGDIDTDTDTDTSDEVPTGLWPLTSLNGSDGSLQGLEELLVSVLGKKAAEKGSFKLVRAQVAAQTYVKMGFAVEKKVAADGETFPEFPEWKTRPKRLRAHFEVLARVEDGGKVVPERIAEVKPFEVEETIAGSVVTGNVSVSRMEVVLPPPVYFTL